MRLRWLDSLVLLYGILLIGFGLYGYLGPSHSLISVIAGGTAGILEIGFAALAKTNPRIGRIGSAVVALLMLGKFLPAWLKTPKLDFLTLWVASLLVFVCLLGGHFYAMSKRKAPTEPRP